MSADLIAATAHVVRSAEDELLVAVEHGDVGTAMRTLSPELRAVIKATVIVGVVGVLVLVLMERVARWPWTMWPLEGITIGLLAAGTAWCFDEPAAEVVDAAPRHLTWRTGARATGVSSCWSCGRSPSSGPAKATSATRGQSHSRASPP
ncbi:hypothetical protein [Nocardioides sp. NPDC006273]|uniref:hypothetical protein n=1 Tax=Nocardioides sp. NPDC006273 TaxID=3155598 RepID=UPI0033B9F893